MRFIRTVEEDAKGDLTEDPGDDGGNSLERCKAEGERGVASQNFVLEGSAIDVGGDSSARPVYQSGGPTTDGQ